MNLYEFKTLSWNPHQKRRRLTRHTFKCIWEDISKSFNWARKRSTLNVGIITPRDWDSKLKKKRGKDIHPLQLPGADIMWPAISSSHSDTVLTVPGCPFKLRVKISHSFCKQLLVRCLRNYSAMRKVIQQPTLVKSPNGRLQNISLYGQSFINVPKISRKGITVLQSVQTRSGVIWRYRFDLTCPQWHRLHHVCKTQSEILKLNQSKAGGKDNL